MWTPCPDSSFWTASARLVRSAATDFEGACDHFGDERMMTALQQIGVAQDLVSISSSGDLRAPGDEVTIVPVDDVRHLRRAASAEGLALDLVAFQLQELRESGVSARRRHRGVGHKRVASDLS